MKATPFQLVITGIFVIFLIGGIGVFALKGGLQSNGAVGTVTIWGTVDRSLMDAYFTSLIADDKSFQNVKYIEIKPETYTNDLIEAFASNKAPDLFMITDAQVVSFKDKVALLPYSIMSQRSFNDAFIDESSLFLLSQGAIAYPLFVDPLVMYWNKDLFAGSGIATYPKMWSELVTIAPRMTALDTTSNVKRSAVALGTYDNVRYAKDIFTALLLQVGNQIISVNADGNFASILAQNAQQGVEPPSQSVLRFYTSFSNSSQSTYSWNRSLPNSFNAFTSGDLGIYFGFASDYKNILARNQNLAFGVANLPQTGIAKSPVTYGRITGLAIPQVAKNTKGAVYILQKLVTATAEKNLSDRIGLPAARRDLLVGEPADPAQSVFAQSALISRGWYDPGIAISGGIIKLMIESTISGKQQLGEAVSNASQSLDDAFANINKK